VRYPGEQIGRHPWPLYEAALLCVLALFFWRPVQLGAAYVPGRRAIRYVLAYALMRLALEPLRADVVRGVIGGLSTSQLIAACVIAVCVWALKKLRPATLEDAAGRGSVTESVTASGG
jgi:prolipoprotein diacylglyceryltransferase